MTCSCTVEGDDREHAPSCPMYLRASHDEWKARAEKAEAAVVSAAGRILTLECSVANAEARAERAEALLREAPVKHDAQCFSPDGCRCNLVFWRAKVWDLLEGKT